MIHAIFIHATCHTCGDAVQPHSLVAGPRLVLLVCQACHVGRATTETERELMVAYAEWVKDVCPQPPAPGPVMPPPEQGMYPWEAAR